MQLKIMEMKNGYKTFEKTIILEVKNKMGSTFVLGISGNEPSYNQLFCLLSTLEINKKLGD